MAEQDVSIHDRITDLVQREHELRTRLGDEHDPEGGAEDRQQLRELEVALDVCWDLLRQRDARRAAGQDPDAASARPADEVEGYWQ